MSKARDLSALSGLEEAVALFLRPVVSQPLASKPVGVNESPFRSQQNPIAAFFARFKR
jgi:hypothetical protein